MRTCSICEKKAIPGIKYKRRGMVKRKGGAGSKIVGKSARQFMPNLQRIKIVVSGTVKRCYVCTGCISAGKILKA